ncbi:hypothetical protein NEF87_004722 [Candidatus Lokiarchaeum ossiferum]|uniref:GTP-binding protein n=1 Tax=Candidatus Lokiarchaeum ossiferum TaxID=2951803 RepID=A0ABY6HY37_9ARCH|nr:hypothetical protein NEF87_004722 [Candidatus Lokiarchaeum sp. B-35]
MQYFTIVHVSSTEKLIQIYYINPITNKRTPLKIKRSLIDNSPKTPVAITTMSDENSLTLYVDKQYKVRGVEQSIFLETSETEQKPLENIKKDTECYSEPDNFGKVLVLGLSKAGKTSIINRLTKNFFAKTNPTLGVNIMKAVLDKTRFVFYDVGGQKMLRKKWTTTVSNPDAIVFVFDINSESDQVEETKIEFQRVIQHYFIDTNRSIPVLILGNKIDIMAKQNISKQSIMSALLSLFEPELYNFNYRVGLVSALTGEGINYNFKWLIAKNIMI